MSAQHASLASGRWQQLSIAEQLGHVGSEVNRARLAIDDEKRFWSAVTRAFELLDLTIEDPRWRSRLRELLRAREVFSDAVLGGPLYRSTLSDVTQYFDRFAYAAQSHRASEKNSVDNLP